jgi:hypothetical protein
MCRHATMVLLHLSMASTHRWLDVQHMNKHHRAHLVCHDRCTAHPRYLGVNAAGHGERHMNHQDAWFVAGRRRQAKGPTAVRSAGGGDR